MTDCTTSCMMATNNEAQHIEECDLCKQSVSFFCRRCGVNLCDPCVTIHLRVKSKTGHDVVDFVSKDDDDTCLCDFHPQNECSAFCKTCDVPICILCVSIKHKSHELSELSDKIEELLKVIARENHRLQSYKQDLDRILDHTTKQLSSISSYYTQKKDEVTARGEEWIELIKKTVKILHLELDGMQKEHEDLLEKKEKKFEEMIGKVDEINGKAIKYHKTKNVRNMQTFIPEIDKQEIPSDISQYSFPIFNECKIDINYMQTYFGYIEKFQETKTSLIGKRFKEIEFSVKKILEAPIVTSVIDTGFPNDDDDDDDVDDDEDDNDESRLYDMAVTDDRKVWMGGRSRELKLFDLQGHLHHAVSITDTGMYLSMFNKHVVYTDYNDNAIKMISDTDTVVTMFTTGEWKPFGVRNSASGDLLVCLCKDDQSKVVRYSSTGTVLQEIQYDAQCQPLYKQAVNITENVNGDIIVTDWKKNAVIAVDRLGIFLYSYSGQNTDLNGSSVATDAFGHVIVTDYLSDKVHMLDREGQFLRYIIREEGIKDPRAVCILGHGEMMVGECLTGIAKRIKYFDD